MGKNHFFQVKPQFSCPKSKKLIDRMVKNEGKEMGTFVANRDIYWTGGFSFRLVASIILLLSLILSNTSFAKEGDNYEGVLIVNPGAELWRDVRQRETTIEGISQIRGVDTGILINNRGDQWARFRVDNLVFYAISALLAISAILLLFYLIRGKVGIDGGLSGRMLHRFTDYERVVHWTLALVFLFLAITGLILLLGRSILIPVLGQEIFSLFASASKEGHNLFGPVFIVSLLMMLLSFLKRNIYEKGDLTWLLKGGGFIGKGHVSGGFFNMGEKTWYWMVILIGLLISASGLILVFPNFGQGRIIMELSHVVHVISAIVLIAVSLGHMYMGSVGTEGTSEGMKTGYVDVNWAAAHHDRWAKACEDDNKIISAEEYSNRKGEVNRPVEATGSVEVEVKS